MDKVAPDLPFVKGDLDSVDWDEFHNSLLSVPGLKRLRSDRWAYKYNVEQTRMNTDPFVRKSMKLWDEETYHSMGGFSKRSRLSTGLNSLKKFAVWEHKKSRMSQDFKDCYARALKDAKRVFTPHEKLKRASVPDVCDTMNLDSAAGFSFPGKKKSEVIEEAFDTASYMAHFLAAGKHIYILSSQTRPTGSLVWVDELKTRPVWVYPAEVTILEGKWALPYYKFLEEEVPTVHFGEGAMQSLAKTLVAGLATESECTEVTLDWSGFDSSVPNFMSEDAFDIIFNSFDETVVTHQGDVIFGGDYMASKQVAIKDFITTYFKKTKIMLPDGSVYQKFHGIPSGSFFTQAVGSIVNYLAVMTLNYYFGWNVQRVRVLGDDSSFLIPIGAGKVTAEAVSTAAWSMFGLTLKKEKLRIAEKQSQRKFLGYQVQAYRYERPTEDWLRMVLYPERDVEFLEQSASRVFAFYLLGGVNDAVYCNFFRDYINRYPVIFGKTLPLTKGLRRLFKFVFRYTLDSLVFPDLSGLDPMKVPFALSLGDAPFG
uniref:RNA-dependent RNA polymerase n=1 Tax=Nigrospora oryzae partitivirus 2 TaxID=3231912 RepID=A0AAU8J5J1_9VIRU